MDKIKLTKEQLTQLAGGVVFTCLFGYFYLFYFWLPTAKTIATNTQKVASMESDISKAKMQKAKYKDLEAKLASLKAEKEAAEKKLPRERKLPRSSTRSFRPYCMSTRRRRTARWSCSSPGRSTRIRSRYSSGEPRP